MSITTLLAKLQARYVQLVNTGTLALIVFLLGLIFGTLARNITKRALHEIKLDYALKKTLGTPIHAEKTISTTIAYLIYTASLIMALARLGIPTHTLTIISLLLLGGVLAAFLVAFKNKAPPRRKSTKDQKETLAALWFVNKLQASTTKAPHRKGKNNTKNHLRRRRKNGKNKQNRS
ncbi:hypothetical protein D6783_03285 [Candidatus Woesearchaeota archaeon]|nr:MAG: hypothetical protein D6783_03285 [Candidatus Woesearchaeota archaeon]